MFASGVAIAVPEMGFCKGLALWSQEQIAQPLADGHAHGRDVVFAPVPAFKLATGLPSRLCIKTAWSIACGPFTGFRHRFRA